MRWLNVVMWAQAALAVASIAGLALDSRQLLGVSVWLKPLKFEISVFIYLLTVGWMVQFYPAGFRPGALIAKMAAAAMAVEIALINLQAWRGTTSHFNEAAAFDGAVFSVMGLFIVLNGLADAWLAWIYWTSPPSPSPGPGLLWGIRWGLVLLLAGSLEAVAMISRSAHTVGAPDGGAGLPMVNWSVAHGDLRAAHFLALHGLQALPLAGWLVDRFGLARPALTVGLAAAAHAALTAALFWQAMAGRPLLPH